MRPAPPSWQQRFNPPPLRIVQPVNLLCHPSPHVLESLNHNPSVRGILIEYGP
jgi:hypothetical protein